jgi:hypothetical protein
MVAITIYATVASAWSCRRRRNIRDAGFATAPGIGLRRGQELENYCFLLQRPLGKLGELSGRAFKKIECSLRNPLQTHLAHAVAANSLGCWRCQIDFAARPKPAVRSLICNRTNHGFSVGNIGHAKPLANRFKHVRTDQVPIGMQPFSVSRDGVIKLCGNAAVWRRLDARKPEIVECVFSAGAKACCDQRQRREYGHNADLHPASFIIRLWARSWRLNALFLAVSCSPCHSGRLRQQVASGKCMDA